MVSVLEHLQTNMHCQPELEGSRNCGGHPAFTSTSNWTRNATLCLEEGQIRLYLRKFRPFDVYSNRLCIQSQQVVYIEIRKGNKAAVFFFQSMSDRRVEETFPVLGQLVFLIFYS